jgi:hypothetical protein
LRREASVRRIGHQDGLRERLPYRAHPLVQQRNLTLFDADEERFEAERNRLGGVLLLKGKDNISSNNERYAKKLKSYTKTLHWNESLRDDSYKSKKNFKAFIARSELKFAALDTFGPDELESR